MVEDGTPGVHAVKHSPIGRQKQPIQATKVPHSVHLGSKARSRHSPKLPPTPCWLCGGMHFVRFCSYRQQKCPTTTEYGFGRLCDSIRQRHRSTRPSRHSTRPTTRSDAVFIVSSVHGSYRRFATIMVDGNPIHFQVDSAADITIINESTWKLMGKPKLQPPSLIAHSASRDRIQFIG
ncbi:hypothetical protein GCK32_022808 [Trichostrongylus colubriformis]|uniref:Peptidase A2 domain-containing protein n=1 Tax=Trichostrongylus colubriformis TaxID=6319 RepID=A0AAN8J386_TRICO